MDRPVENGEGRRSSPAALRDKKKGGPFGPRIPEILDFKRDVPKNYFFAAFLAGFFAAFFAAFLAAFFVAMSVTSSWQI